MASSTQTKRTYRMTARADATAATRRRILSAALRHFAGRPYEEVRLSDIAAEAGVTVQTVHTQFGTKDDLFVAGWRWVGTEEQPRRNSAPVGDVETAVGILYDSYERDGDAVLRLLAVEDRIAAVHLMADEGRAFHREWVTRTFAPAIKGLRGERRRRRIAALVVATDLLTWKLLRREMALERATAERVVNEMLTALKGAA